MFVAVAIKQEKAAACPRSYRSSYTATSSRFRSSSFRIIRLHSSFRCSLPPPHLLFTKKDTFNSTERRCGAKERGAAGEKIRDAVTHVRRRRRHG